MDDTDYKKQRTSLMLISIAVILYVLGEGQIGTKGSIFGGTITFLKPDILEQAGILIYLWLNWRYMLSCKPFLIKFGNHFSYFVYKSDKYKKYVHDNFEKIKEINPSATYLNQCLTKTKIWHEGGDATLPPLIKNLFWPNKFFFNHGNHLFQGDAIHDLELGNMPVAFPTPDEDNTKISIASAPFFKMLFLELRVLFHVAWAHKPFSDIIAPFIISAYAAYLLVANIAHV